MDVDDGDGHRLSIDLELPGSQRSSRTQRDIRGRPSHVERENAFVAGAASPGERTHDTPGRAGQDGVDRLPHGTIDGQRATVGAHDRHPVGACLTGKTTQVVGHQGSYVGVHHRRGGPFVLAELGE
jgi:hypothetical protein